MLQFSGDSATSLRSAQNSEGAAVESRTEGARRWLKGARRKPGKHSATDGKRPVPESLRSAQNDGVKGGAPLFSAISRRGMWYHLRHCGEMAEWLKARPC